MTSIDIKSVFSFSKLYRTAAVSITCSILGGCLISPYWGQNFESMHDPIPFTFYTLDSRNPIILECTRPNSGGYPLNDSPTWEHVGALYPSPTSTLDPQGNKIYSASSKHFVPSRCWRNLPASDEYDKGALVRITQNGSDDKVFVFDKPGLECLGRWIGNGTSWFNWLSRGCYKSHYFSSDPRRAVFIKAKS